MRPMRGFLLAVVTMTFPVVSGCSVEAGKIPSVAAEPSDQFRREGTLEIRSTMAHLMDSAALISRIQNTIQRGLAENQVNTDAVSSSPSGLLETSEADVLTFDKDQPEKFKYRLNNSASLSLTTKSGGRVSVILEGSIDDSSGKIKIKDSKVDIVHETANGNQSFRILVETNTSVNGEHATQWQIDFSQLGALYRDIGGEDEATANLKGVLTVRVSESGVAVSAKDLKQVAGEVEITYDVIDIDMSIAPKGLRKLNVSGSVDQKKKRVGAFAVIRSTSGNSTEMSFKLDMH